MLRVHVRCVLHTMPSTTRPPTHPPTHTHTGDVVEVLPHNLLHRVEGQPHNLGALVAGGSGEHLPGQRGCRGRQSARAMHAARDVASFQPAACAQT